MDEFEIKLKNGDTEAFEKLVSEYQSKIFSLSLGFLSDREDALDVTQEVFLKIYRSLGSFKGDSTLATWIYSIARNMCIDFLRKRKRTVSGELPETLSDDPSLEPEEAYGRLEKRELIRKHISEMPPNYRTVLLLREYQGFSYKEIADALEISEGTVKSRISRAREYLVKILTANKELFLI